MKSAFATLAALLALAASAPASAEGADTGAVRRFALIIGANDGGKDRVQLHFAGTDARAFAGVLRELGGTDPADILTLTEPTLADIDAGFARIGRQMSAARAGGARVQLIVYYSGHSNEEGLLVGGRLLGYDELRQRIRSAPADVQIAILDSCASGSFTRTKGGTRRPAFLVDESLRVTGHAFLSSSSATEAAQESDRLSGSFFTHYLIGGLRGAADANRDRRVTLSEAYQFAFHETVARTKTTRYGAQHPAYDMHLVGSGDIVFTDLRDTSAALVLAEDVAGRLQVRRAPDQLVLELSKQPGATMILGLAPGDYELLLEHDRSLRRARATLARDRQTRVALAHFSAAEREATIARGPEAAPLKNRVINLDLIDLPSADDRDRHVISFNLLIGGGAELEGFELGGLANHRSRDARGVQIAGITNLTQGASDVQLAGIFNRSGARSHVAQIAGVGNWTGDSRGVQLAGIANAAAAASSVQIAGIANVSGTTSDLQLGGIFNLAPDGARIAQIAGIANSSGRVQGVQIAGLLNLSTSGTRGLQIAGIGNHAVGDLRGLQIAGTHNLADQVHGVQLALVNIGRGDVSGAQIGLVNVGAQVRGLQLGLVNVATEPSPDAVPIGLVSVVPEGHRAVEAWVGDIIPARVGVKLGSPSVYSLLAVGASDEHFAFGAGIGTHVPMGDLYLDVDLSHYGLRGHELEETEADHMAELRAMLGIPLAGGLSAFGGVSLSGVFSHDDDRLHRSAADVSLFPERRWTGDHVTFDLSPGLFVGLSR